jgi:dihydroorotase/N-acyl-D-amino-acid deacylase
MEIGARSSVVSRLCLVAALTGCGTGTPAPRDQQNDLILKGGWIVDGTGNPRYEGDVAIRGDRVSAVGYLGSTTARDTIDVRGLVVAPGFIDMLGQSEGNALIDNRVLSKVTQGITTEVTGEGESPAPLTDRLVALDSAYLKRYRLDMDWRDLDGYFRRLERTPPTINIATFVGATQVRRAVIGDADRKATPKELAQMEALVDSAMRQGALGVSTSLIYAPAIYAPTDELIALARVARRYGGIYATHMRNEGAAIDAALDETFQIARAANIPVEIWHLKVSGRPNWGRMPHVLARIDSARAAGIDVMADQYSYIASATSLDATIPVWALSGGRDSLLIRLRDPRSRARIREEMVGGGPEAGWCCAAGRPPRAGRTCFAGRAAGTASSSPARSRTRSNICKANESVRWRERAA